MGQYSDISLQAPNPPAPHPSALTHQHTQKDCLCTIYKCAQKSSLNPDPGNKTSSKANYISHGMI